MNARAPLVVACVVWAVLGACSCPGPISEPNDGGDAGPPQDAGIDGGPDCPGLAETDLVTGLTAPRRIAADETFAYVSVGGLPFFSSGSVVRAPLDGGEVDVLVDAGSSFDAIAVNDSEIVVIDSIGALRIDKTSGAVKRIAASVMSATTGETDVALIGSDAIVATGFKWLARFNADGGIHYLYTGDAGSQVRAVQIDEGEIYFLVSGSPVNGLYVVPADGGGPPARLRPEPEAGRALLLTPTDFYWTDDLDGDGGVFTAPRDGGASTQIVFDLCAPARLALDGLTLYVKQSTECATTEPSASFFLEQSTCSPVASPVGPIGVGPGDVLVTPAGVLFTSEAGTDAGYAGILR